jgi:uncharacterized protein YjiS (DUF1127 family)
MQHAEHGVGNKLQARRGDGSSGIIAAVVAALAAWAVFRSERARERRTLAGLDDRMLKDIGLTRADVAAESGKPFWRV